MAEIPMVDGVPVAIPPPAGYVVDFDNPQRNSVIEAYCLFGVGNFLCLLFMLQRAYVKLVLQKRVQIEDGCLLVAWIFSITVQSLILRDFIDGIMGTHAWEMPLIPKFQRFASSLYLLPILYNPVQAGAKLTLLLLYRRLAPQQWYQISVYVVGFIVVGSSTAIMFATIFPCRPTSAAWDITIEDPDCINRPALYQATAVLGAVTDAMVLAVPIPIVVTLQIPRKQKIGLIAVFGIGFLTVFTSIMRLVALIDSMGDFDQSWGGGPVLLWIFAEANLSCICGTLPTLKPFFNHISPRLLGYSSGSSQQPAPRQHLSRSNNLPTFGGSGAASKPQYDDYDRFDDTDPMYPLETISHVQASKAAGSERRGDGFHMDGQHEEQEDDGSEKGIMQTRTTTVTVSASKRTQAGSGRQSR